MNENQAYYESIMPGMTIEQAFYILRQEYSAFPYEVRSKATTIVSVEQYRIASINHSPHRKI